jgi:hypothetical protein
MALSNRFFSILWLFIVIAGLNSCSLSFEKRHYRKGYHIEVVKNNPHRIVTNQYPSEQAVNITPPEKNRQISSEQSKKHELNDSKVNVVPHSPKRKMPVIDKKSVVKISSEKIKRSSDCDVITLKDGAQIDAMIINIGEDVIAYKKCNFESGPVYTISTGTVDIIHLRNGDYYKPKGNVINTNTRTNGNGNGVGEMIVSILGFVFSLFAFVMCFFGFAYGTTILTGIFGSFGFLLGIFGTVFSAIRMNPGNKTFTLPGVVLGALAILLFMVALTILVLV